LGAVSPRHPESQRRLPPASGASFFAGGPFATAASNQAPAESRRERIVFITGKLAEFSLRRLVEKLSSEIGFDFAVTVLPISVAALMHVDWVARKLVLLQPADRVVLPGWCQGDPQMLSHRYGVPFERGPKDLHDLPDYFGRAAPHPDLSRYDIEILAEINHAPRLTDSEILRLASGLRNDGADVIDVGCVPGECWSRVGDVTRLLRGEGFRVSIDSFDRREVEEAVAAGAELVLSCNGTNVEWAARLGVDLVAIPDDHRDLATLEPTLERLHAAGARFRLDPIIEPIGQGFARSLERFYLARHRWPAAPMMMGLGNVTELTEVDSTGINMLLAAICQELGVRSVLTTQVINWARSSVRELDLARRLLRHCFSYGLVPKHVDSRLVMLRDPKVVEMSDEELARIAGGITDPNYRIFVQGGALHLVNRDGHWTGGDPFELFDRAMAVATRIDAAHAFYLGYELSKAATALALGKQYVQDEALSWGFLTVPESGHRLAQKKQQPPGGPGGRDAGEQVDSSR
jgi:dihydropteroate synthase